MNILLMFGKQQNILTAICFDRRTEKSNIDKKNKSNVMATKS